HGRSSLRRRGKFHPSRELSNQVVEHLARVHRYRARVYGVAGTADRHRLAAGVKPLEGRGQDVLLFTRRPDQDIEAGRRLAEEEEADTSNKQQDDADPEEHPHRTPPRVNSWATVLVRRLGALWGTRSATNLRLERLKLLVDVVFLFHLLETLVEGVLVELRVGLGARFLLVDLLFHALEVA